MVVGLVGVCLLGGAPQWLGERPLKVERIVSLAPSATETLFALGVGHKVVGVTRYDDTPPEVKALPRVGGFIDPEPEAVLALAPDLIVAIPTSGGRRAVDTLARLGTPVLVLPAQTLEDLYASIHTLGDVVGESDAARALTERLRAQRRAIAERHQADPIQRVLVVFGTRPLVVAGPGSFIDGLLGDVRARNVVTRGGTFPILDLEAVAALAPDAIIDLTAGHHKSRDAFWRRAMQTPALAGGRVHLLDEDGLMRPGPRLIAGLAVLGRVLHGGKVR